MAIRDDPSVRATLFDHVEKIQGYPDFGEPTAAMWEAFGEMLDNSKRVSHAVDRGTSDFAESLNVSELGLMNLFTGKSVLDIGCGEGVFSSQLARNETTNVTALDYNPKVLGKISPKPNLRVVEGSGYDLQASLGDEEFDVVLSAYSTLMWARNAEQTRLAITEALRATRVGGIAIFIPFMQHLQSHEAYHDCIARIIVSNRVIDEDTAEDIKYASDSLRAHEWTRWFNLQTLRDAEESGAIDCAFVASRTNAQKLQIRPRLGPTYLYEDFSVIATVLDK